MYVIHKSAGITVNSGTNWTEFMVLLSNLELNMFKLTPLFRPIWAAAFTDGINRFKDSPLDFPLPFFPPPFSFELAFPLAAVFAFVFPLEMAFAFVFPLGAAFAFPLEAVAALVFALAEALPEMFHFEFPVISFLAFRVSPAAAALVTVVFFVVTAWKQRYRV